MIAYPTLLLAFVMSFTLVFALSPVIIRISHKRKLLAVPEARSSHAVSTPFLGGVGIFFGIFFSTLLLAPDEAFPILHYLLAGLLIIFMVGAKDDLEPLSPRNKTAGLLLSIAILVFMGQVQLNSFYGLLGMHSQLPPVGSALLSGFTLYVIINAFNLIDGINGLASCLAAFICMALGTWFFLAALPTFGVLAWASAGAVLAFLRYNLTPAQIFMGDCGSLLLGGIIALLSIKFIHVCDQEIATDALIHFHHPVAVAISLLIVPLFDTLRVFTMRIAKGQSPFKADKSHIHHLLLSCGRTHGEASLILLLVSMVFFALTLALDGYLGLHVLLALQLALACSLTFGLYLYLQYKQEASREGWQY